MMKKWNFIKILLAFFSFAPSLFGDYMKFKLWLFFFPFRVWLLKSSRDMFACICGWKKSIASSRVKASKYKNICRKSRAFHKKHQYSLQIAFLSPRVLMNDIEIRLNARAPFKMVYLCHIMIFLSLNLLLTRILPVVVWPDISSPAQSLASVIKVPSNSCLPRLAFCSFCFGSFGDNSGSLRQQMNTNARHSSTISSPAKNVNMLDRRKHHHFRTIRHSSIGSSVVTKSSSLLIPTELCTWVRRGCWLGLDCHDVGGVKKKLQFSIRDLTNFVRVISRFLFINHWTFLSINFIIFPSTSSSSSSFS